MTFHIAIYLKHVKSPPSPQTNKKTQTQIHSTESVQRAPSDFLFSHTTFCVKFPTISSLALLPCMELQRFPWYAVQNHGLRKCSFL